LLDTRRNKRTAVMMPYVNRLQLFVDWYCQLWRSRSANGTARVRAARRRHPTGARHGCGGPAQPLQMYLESRHDKFFTFIELETCEVDLPIPLTVSMCRIFRFSKAGAWRR